MEILRFDGGRMKITLSKKELALYEIDLGADKGDCAKMKKALRTILALARLGPDEAAAEDERCVQMYPSRDGGCEIFVHRKIQNDLPGLPAPANARGAGRYLCRFEGENEARAFFAHLQNEGASPALRNCENGAWYLISDATGASLAALEELGRRCLYDPAPYLYEHFGAVKARE